MAPRWVEYVTTLRTVKEARNRQEVDTIAACLDLLIRGCYLEVGDILAQRMKALELTELGGAPDAAQQLELVSSAKSLLTPAEKAKATRAASTLAKVERSLALQPAK